MASKGESDDKEKILKVLTKLPKENPTELNDCDRKMPSDAAKIIGSDVSKFFVSIQPSCFVLVVG